LLKRFGIKITSDDLRNRATTTKPLIQKRPQAGKCTVEYHVAGAIRAMPYKFKKLSPSLGISHQKQKTA